MIRAGVYLHESLIQIACYRNSPIVVAIIFDKTRKSAETESVVNNSQKSANMCE